MHCVTALPVYRHNPYDFANPKSPVASAWSIDSPQRAVTETDDELINVFITNMAGDVTCEHVRSLVHQLTGFVSHGGSVIHAGNQRMFKLRCTPDIALRLKIILRVTKYWSIPKGMVTNAPLFGTHLPISIITHVK